MIHHKNLASIWLILLLGLAFSISAGPIEEMKAGEWFEIPNSRLDAVKPNPLPVGATGIAAVMSAWSGGAYDTKRDRLIVWGGGHTDYSGNEVYVFDIHSLKWERVNEPSTDVGGNESSGLYPDGNPRSQHTYNYIQYLSSIDRFCVFGSSGLYPSGQTGSSKTPCFDFENKKWEQKAEAKSFGIGNFSAIDGVTATVWSGKGTLTRFDPMLNVWGKQTEYDNDIQWNNSLTLCADPKRRFLIAMGGGKVYKWNIADLTKPIAAQLLPTTGGDLVVSMNSPALAYDPIGERMVSWGGGPDVFTLNPETGVWSTHAKTSGTAPVSPEHTGTYGRFRYVASKNVFVVVNRTSENVFIYKLSSGPGIPTVLKPPVRLGKTTLRSTLYRHGNQIRVRSKSGIDSKGRK